MDRRNFVKTFSIFTAGLVALPGTALNIVSEVPEVAFTTATCLTYGDLVEYINISKEWKSYSVGDIKEGEPVQIKYVNNKPLGIVKLNESGELSFT